MTKVLLVVGKLHMSDLLVREHLLWRACPVSQQASVG